MNEHSDFGQPLTGSSPVTFSRRRFVAMSLRAVAVLALLPACATPPAAVPTAAPAAAPAPTSAAAPSTPAAANAAPTAAAQPAQTAPAVVAASSSITIATPRNISAVDARRHRITEEMNLYFHLFDPLVDLDEKIAVVPRLAESWEAVDPKTWRFKLRQGVKFQNGEPFNAEAAKFSFDQYATLDPPYFYIAFWAPAWPPTAKVEDEYTLVVTTPEPLPQLPRLITRFGMLPPAATLDAGFADKPVGSGPYQVSEWVKGERVVIEANPDYWGGAPAIKQMIWRSIPDAASRMAALQANEIDLAWAPPLERLGELSTAGYTVISQPSTGMGQVAINFRNPKSPVADIKVRKALSLAVDGQALIKEILADQGRECRGPASMVTFASVDAGGYPKRDLEASKRLLGEAGFADGLELTWIFTPGEFAKDSEITEAVIGQLSEAGIEVKLEELDGGQYGTRRGTPDWDLATNSVGSFTGDAAGYIGMANTVSGYKSPAVDALQAQAAAAPDPEHRTPLVQEALKTLWADSPYLWSFERFLIFGLNKKISGARLIPADRLLLDKATLAS